MVERDLQPLEDVRARLGLPQVELDPPPHHFAPELDEVLQHLDERQRPRPPAHDREHDDAEADLQRRVLVQVVQDDVRHFAALQLDDDAQPFAVRLVAEVGDALERLVAHQLGDLLDELRLVDLVRDLGDDDGAAVALGRFLDASPWRG